MTHGWNAEKHAARGTDHKCAESIEGYLKRMSAKMVKGDYRLKIMEVDGEMGLVVYHKNCPVNVKPNGWYNPNYIVAFYPSTQVDG